MERDKCANVRVLVYKVQVRLRGRVIVVYVYVDMKSIVNKWANIHPSNTYMDKSPSHRFMPLLYCVQALEALFLLDPHHNLVCQFLWCREFEKFHLLAKRLEQGSDHNPGLG